MNTCKICGKQYELINHLSFHIHKHHGLLYKDYYDKYIKTPEEGLCRVCGKPTNWVKKEYKKFCSNACINNDPEVREKNKQGVIRSKANLTEDDIKQINEKRDRTCIEKYGVKNISQADGIQEKKDQTTISHLGVKNYKMTEEGQKRFEQTMIERYNAPHSMQVPEMKERIQKTFLDKYGYITPAKNEKIIEKLRNNANSRGFQRLLKKVQLPQL
jgi:hypothetical protein